MEKKNKKITVTTEDQETLNGIIFLAKNALGVVQLNAATGADTKFYHPYAEFLRENGFNVCVWDYRGMGESRAKNIKNIHYKFSDVGLYDIPAITSELKKLFPDLPLLCIGHSVGAQQIGLVKNNHEYQGMLAFATSVGNKSFMPWHFKLQTFYFMNIFSPISIKTLGYVASKRFGIMEDLPSNVLLEWRDWCSKKDYLFDKQFYGKTIPRGNYDNLPFPITVFGAIDDPISNQKATKRFWSHITSTKETQFRWYNPKELGVKKIEHFGFFRNKFKDDIWKDSLSVLKSYI